jgi:mannonate dehydratase
MAGAATASALAGCEFDFRDGFFNACRAEIPATLARSALVRSAWQGLEPRNVWDVHCHVFGNGDSGSGLWFNPAMERIWKPQQYLQKLFYLNAGCVHDSPGNVDASVVDRLRNQTDAMPAGVHLLLLAFDWARDEAGRPLQELSTFHVPDAYASGLQARFPGRFEWAASIHPYAPDALDRIEAAMRMDARAIKWLPSAQNIDPSSARCDRFYRELAERRLPLITHAGDERAVHGHAEGLGNPLLLRRALDAGVRVVVAHCASLGVGRDLDRGAGGPPVQNFDLFTRLMDTRAYAGNLYADISAITQGNRMEVIAKLLDRQDWHPRLLNGSDYPLPGILPLVSLDALAGRGLLDSEAVAPLREIREHNALLFDMVLKRSLHHRGARFSRDVFETRAFFLPTA